MSPSSDQDLTPVADCRCCAFRRSLLLSGRCAPGDACVVVDSGRQIDRFLRMNPELAPRYMKDPFWERRAIAAALLGMRTRKRKGVRFAFLCHARSRVRPRHFDRAIDWTGLRRE